MYVHYEHKSQIANKLIKNISIKCNQTWIFTTKISCTFNIEFSFLPKYVILPYNIQFYYAVINVYRWVQALAALS